MKKVILAFSGGLDTSFCIPYLNEKGYDVVTVTVNTGGFTTNQLKEIAQKAKQLGALKHLEKDGQKDLYNNFATNLIKANYLKGGVYPACVGPERIVIAQAVAKVALEEKAEAVAHGSTGAGNDQVRFDLAFQALLPKVEIIAPIREEGLSRVEEVAFLEKKGFKVDATQKDYSINVGLLGTTIGGKETLSTAQCLPEGAFPNIPSPHSVNGKPIFISLGFEKGLPITFQGEKMHGVEIINQLNAAAASSGFGKDDHIGTTILGTKGRVGFEAPAMKILIKAHTELEKITLTSKQLFWKNTLGNLYGDLIHEGLYFEPLVKNFESFLNSANAFVEGEVALKLQQGLLFIESIKSPYSLMNNRLGKYGEKTGAWTGAEAKGFCKLYGLESANAFLTQQSHD